MKIVFHEFTLAAIALIFVLAAFVSGVAVLWLFAVPFSVGAAAVLKNKGHSLLALFVLFSAALYLANFLVRL